jgi:hypothetical protein
VRDPRGSLVHVRRRDTGECVGCIEAGLFEIVRSVLAAERARGPDLVRGAPGPLPQRV